MKARWFCKRRSVKIDVRAPVAILGPFSQERVLVTPGFHSLLDVCLARREQRWKQLKRIEKASVILFLPLAGNQNVNNISKTHFHKAFSGRRSHAEDVQAKSNEFSQCVKASAVQEKHQIVDVFCTCCST